MRQAIYEEINGKKVFYILSEPADKTGRIVIMSHGFRGSSTGPARAFVNFEKVLLSEGFSVLRFDQPNSSNSEGDYINSSFNEWVATTAYFAKKFLDDDYEVALLGQSMGATTTVVASARKELADRIKCLLLWVPDPKSGFNREPTKVYEEGGQKYRGTFWEEARDSNFFGSIDTFTGSIHLVYGENDKYIPKELRDEVIARVKEKGQQVMILKGQDHSSWDFDITQSVFEKELNVLKKSFN